MNILQNIITMDKVKILVNKNYASSIRAYKSLAGILEIGYSFSLI